MIIKSILSTSVILISLALPIVGYASVTPVSAECRVEVKVSDIISMSAEANVNHDKPDRVGFLITETDCNFLSLNTRYESSSIHYHDTTLILRPDTTVKGEVARSSAMGPGGVVSFTVFQHPDFSPEHAISFSFSY